MGEPILDYAVVTSRLGEAPTLLLGNGFSIAYSLDFQYAHLRELAPLPRQLDAAFDDLGTTNFEELLRWFAVSRPILGRLDLLGGIDDDLAGYEHQVRTAMIAALTRANPRSFAEMSYDELTHAQSFLAPYARIFTLCYDLLLYWLAAATRKKDAFFPQAEGAFRWDASSACQVYWLHGGFHLYPQRDQTYKVVAPRKPRSGAALLAKIEENIEVGIVPLIVAEGQSEQKRTAIARNNYLNIALNRLASAEGTIVTFGASFQQDAHILDAIVRGRADQLFIGVQGLRGMEHFVAQHGDIAHIAHERAQWRGVGGLPPQPLQVAFWDTSPDTIVWGRAPRRRT